MRSLSTVIHEAIKRHAGLSDWDDENIEWEVKAIIRAIRREGFVVTKIGGELIP